MIGALTHDLPAHILNQLHYCAPMIKEIMYGEVEVNLHVFVNSSQNEKEFYDLGCIATVSPGMRCYCLTLHSTARNALLLSHLAFNRLGCIATVSPCIQPPGMNCYCLTLHSTARDALLLSHLAFNRPGCIATVSP
jgi:hypothetical protein